MSAHGLPSTVTEVVVCTTCRLPGTARDLPAAGGALLDAVHHAQQDAPPHPRVRVRGVACMSACSRGCAVAFQAAGKHSYLFGDLPPDADTARQVLRCAALHADTADGALARDQRPERLRNGILARLPPGLAGGGA